MDVDSLKPSEFGPIPRSWTVAKLASVSERIMVGIASAATHAYRSAGIPLLRNQNIKSGRLDDSDILYVDPLYEEGFRNKRLRRGDLLTSRTGYPGMTCVIPAAYDGAQSFTTLITRPRHDVVDSEFLCHFVNSGPGQLFFERSQIGGAQKNVNAGTLRSMPVPLPPSDEQRAIAAALNDVDALIEALDRLIAKKRDLKQAAMQQLLTGKTRLPGFTGEWSPCPLGSIGSWFSGGTPSKSIPELWSGTIPWVSPKDMKVLRLTDAQDHVSESALGRGTRLLPTGALLLVVRGMILAHSAPVARAERPVAFNQDIKAVVVRSGVDSDFLLWWLAANEDVLLSKTNESTHGTKRIPSEELFRLTVHLPTAAEQTAIANILTDMDAELTALEQRRDKTRLIKQGMMQELLTGRTRLV